MSLEVTVRVIRRDSARRSEVTMHVVRGHSLRQSEMTPGWTDVIFPISIMCRSTLPLSLSLRLSPLPYLFLPRLS
jgi:hypothetical protein